MSDTEPTRRAPRRRRRANVTGGRQHAHQVRVTGEEEARLLALAGEQQVSIPRVLIESALAGGAQAAADRREAMEGLWALHDVVAGVANNVNQIARIANTERRLPVGTDEVRAKALEVMRELDVAIGRLVVTL